MLLTRPLLLRLLNVTKNASEKTAARRLRPAPRKYQLDVEIVKKLPGLKLSQNKALWALVAKSLV